MKVFTCAAKLAAAAGIPAARSGFKLKGQSAELAKGLENKSLVCVRSGFSRVSESSGFPGLPGPDGTMPPLRRVLRGTRSRLDVQGTSPQGRGCSSSACLCFISRICTVFKFQHEKGANGSRVQERALLLATLAAAHLILIFHFKSERSGGHGVKRWTIYTAPWKNPQHLIILAA